MTKQFSRLIMTLAWTFLPYLSCREARTRDGESVANDGKQQTVNLLNKKSWLNDKFS
jgi:hypothetical protein